MQQSISRTGLSSEDHDAFCLSPYAGGGLIRLLRGVTDRLDIVPVQVEHEGAVVVRMIMRANAGRAVVLPAGRQRRVVECVDAGAILHRNRDVQGMIQSALAADPEAGLTARTEARRPALVFVLLHFHDQCVAERRERLLVERFGARVIGNRKADVVEHVWRLKSGRYTWRSTISALISAIAFAGLRLFGHALVQFMMVWQR